MKEGAEEYRMTTLETVALDQRRWSATALELKNSNWARFRLMVVLSLAGAILEALAVQIHTSYPVASQVAGYAGAVALALVLVVRAKGLRRERVEAWVQATAAGQLLKSEIYRYRTSVGPYSGRDGSDPDVVLSQRRDRILEKVKSIQKYIVESEPKRPESKQLAPLGPLDADGYIAERVEGEISMFRKFIRDLPEIQNGWLRIEYFLSVAAVLLAATLAISQNQAYGAWVIVAIFLSLASGVSVKSERYATLIVGHRFIPERLTSILEQWRVIHGGLDQLVEKVESVVLNESQAWVLGLDEFQKESVPSQAADSSPELTFHAPASQ
jgi:hypothetical protein